MFKSPGLLDKFDLDFILSKRNRLSKFTYEFRCLGIKDIPKKFLIENSSINVEFLENKTREITTRIYLLSIAKIVNSVQQISTGALLIVNNYIIRLNLGK